MKQCEISFGKSLDKNLDGFSERKQKKNFFVRHFREIFIILLFLIVVELGFLFLFPGLMINGFERDIKIDYLSEYSDDYGKICFGNFLACSDVEVESFGEVDTEKLGNYEKKYIIHLKNGFERELIQNVSVVDREKPLIEVSDEKIAVCPDGKVPSFNYKITDNYDGDLSNKAEIAFFDGKVKIFAVDSSGNTSEHFVVGEVGDKEAPHIELNGAKKYEFIIGDEINIPEPSVTDNCDEVGLEKIGEVDMTKVGKYELSYRAIDKSNNEEIAKREIVISPMPENGTIYLTFDDGPSGYTNKLLDVLREYGVKATFFVTGSGSDSSIRRMFDEGHSIGLHTFTHDYSYVYSSIDNYFADLNRIQERVRNITGQETKLIRFPGGSSNTVSRNYDGGTRIMTQLVSEVRNRGYQYFDWNISSGDAGGIYTSDGVYNNVINHLVKGGKSVILQHDSKGFSVDAVENIIRYGKSHGYRFSGLDISSYAAHHGLNN